MDINKANIANALHSVAKEHIVATADEIYDNDRGQYQSEINFDLGHIVDNPEFVKVVLDSEGKILYGVKQDGDFVFGCGVPSQIQERLDEIYDTYGKYEDNPEYVRVYLDKEGKILWGIQKDGNIYYGTGVPNQVKSYIDEKISELSLDEYEAIVNFLGDLVNSGTLQELLDAKVDKEEGKSLIDSEYASTKSNIENPEFLEVTTDSEDKVLEGIQQDGTKVIGGNLNVGGSASISGDIRVIGNMEVSGVSYKVIENPEYLAAWLDAEDKVIFGFKTDGNIYVGNVDFLNDIKNNQEAISEIQTTLASISSTIEPLDIDALSSITAVENPEFLEAKVDAEGKLIEGINKNGEKIFGVIPPQIKQYIDENMPVGVSGIQSIEYDDATGDMYATYDDESGVTDVSMDSNGDIYVEYETDV